MQAFTAESLLFGPIVYAAYDSWTTVSGASSALSQIAQTVDTCCQNTLSNSTLQPTTACLVQVVKTLAPGVNVSSLGDFCSQTVVAAKSLYAQKLAINIATGCVESVCAVVYFVIAVKKVYDGLKQQARYQSV